MSTKPEWNYWTSKRAHALRSFSSRVLSPTKQHPLIVPELRTAKQRFMDVPSANVLCNLFDADDLAPLSDILLWLLVNKRDVLFYNQGVTASRQQRPELYFHFCALARKVQCTPKMLLPYMDEAIDAYFATNNFLVERTFILESVAPRRKEPRLVRGPYAYDE